jgi:hypothetical protein
MRGVELGFEQEGVVAFVGVHGDVHVRDLGLFEMADELGLLLGVEAEVAVDAEDEIVLSGGGAAGEELLIRLHAGVPQRIKRSHMSAMRR